LKALEKKPKRKEETPRGHRKMGKRNQKVRSGTDSKGAIDERGGRKLTYGGYTVYEGGVRDIPR